jgi:hypothetical protein
LETKYDGIDWLKLLDEARINQRELATALDTSPGQISALVNHRDGVGKKLKRAALDYLTSCVHGLESEQCSPEDSELSAIAKSINQNSNIAPEDWKLRAIKAESEVERLRAALHLLTAPGKVSANVSSTTLAEAEEKIAGIVVKHYDKSTQGKV